MRQSPLLIVDPGVQLWGSERALAATLTSLLDTWGRVVLITPAGAALSDMVREKSEFSSIEVAHAPIAYMHKKFVLNRVVAGLHVGLLLIRYKPKHIYLNQAGLCRLLSPLARILKTPLSIHVRLLEDIVRVDKLRGTPSSLLHKIYVSDSMFKMATPVKCPYTFIYKAYDPYDFGEISSSSLTRKIDFVSVGRLSYSKGPHLLIESFFHLSTIVKTVQVHIFGESVVGDKYGEMLKFEVNRLSLDGKVIFKGFSNNVIYQLKNYRFLVLTSKYETLGRVVMEAWAAGVVPIVYSGSGGAAEIVHKSGGGLIYSDWNNESLLSVLNKALLMPELDRRSIADAGLQWGKKHLNLIEYKKNLNKSIYDSAVDAAF